MTNVANKAALRFKYTTKFSLPKIACPAIVYADIVVVIDPFFVGVCPWIKVYRYNPTEICQQRLQGVRNMAQKLCSWERSFIDLTVYHDLKIANKDRVRNVNCNKKHTWMSQNNAINYYTNIKALLFTEYDVARNSHVLHWTFSIPRATSY